MKKITLITLATFALAACGESESPSTKGAKKVAPSKPGDVFFYQCPEQQQQISLTNVKGNHYSMGQGMVMTCLTRTDEDGYRNYNPQEGSFNFGFQINPKGEVFYVKFGEFFGPCEIVRNSTGGFLNPRCLPENR